MNPESVLKGAITHAQQYFDELPAPSNEANTCDWIIRPLLVSLGYLNHEIHAQAADVSNKFPDYTVLPDSNHKWFVEAKSWKVKLESIHVDQAINFVHSSGCRWVVLSNGREWQLYDDTIIGQSKDRLVATAYLKNESEIFAFLSAVSKAAVTSGETGKYAEHQRIKGVLVANLHNAQSPIVTNIAKCLKHSFNINARPDQVIQILKEIYSSEKPGQTEIQPVRPAPEIPGTQQNSSVSSEEVWICKQSGCYGEGVYEKGGIRVRAGARVRVVGAPSHQRAAQKQFDDLLHEGILTLEGDHYVLTQDRWFKTPSAASDFVLTAASNGWIMWRLPDGTTLDAKYRKS